MYCCLEIRNVIENDQMCLLLEKKREEKKIVYPPIFCREIFCREYFFLNNLRDKMCQMCFQEKKREEKKIVLSSSPAEATIVRPSEKEEVRI